MVNSDNDFIREEMIEMSRAKKAGYKMVEKKDYNSMTREELIEVCKRKDNAITEYLNHSERNECTLYGKSDIMEIYKCRSEKALNILKLYFQMGYGNKIGKEYYIPKTRHDDFIKDFAGKEIFV